MDEEQVQAPRERELLTVERRVLQLFALVGDGILGITEALLSADRETAKELLARDELVDALYMDVEALVQERIATLDLPRDRLHELIVILRMLPELERSGDLAEHIAWRASRGLGGEISARSRGLIQRMGEIVATMWRATADGFADRTPDIARQVDEMDDELDELHVMLTAEIVGGGLPVPVAIELAMVGRFYERLGDHAKNLADRIESLAAGVGDIPVPVR